MLRIHRSFPDERSSWWLTMGHLADIISNYPKGNEQTSFIDQSLFYYISICIILIGSAWGVEGGSRSSTICYPTISGNVYVYLTIRHMFFLLSFDQSMKLPSRNFFFFIAFVFRRWINEPGIKSCRPDDGKNRQKLGIGQFGAAPCRCHFVQDWIGLFELLHSPFVRFIIQTVMMILCRERTSSSNK